ncbi:hypothetical protein Rmf_01840 [Roseomonas fluvialis]|uniref:Permease n=2 Tax=Roseomonas fluvialis TaxID=1750527 RepID=A0ABM7XXN2_9PROT|nr:hypothetical protein Rmf_01840 [Roseomonas fluvialis]
MDAHLILLSVVTVILVLGVMALTAAPAFGLGRSWDFVTWMIAAPAIYLAAWQLLSLESIAAALRGAALATAMCAAAFGATFVAGFATVGFAIPVAALLSVSMIGEWLTRRDDIMAGSGCGAGRFAHTAGLVAFLAGLVPAAMHVSRTGVDGWSVALLVAATLPHALLTSILRGSALPVATQLRRASVLVAVVGVSVAGFLGWDSVVRG